MAALQLPLGSDVECRPSRCQVRTKPRYSKPFAFCLKHQSSD